jgi:hypothetical protein
MVIKDAFLMPAALVVTSCFGTTTTVTKLVFGILFADIKYFPAVVTSP